MDDERGMKIIFSQYLAGWLMMHGYMLRGMRRDKIKHGKNVFLFKWSEELENDIEKYNNK